MTPQQEDLVLTGISDGHVAVGTDQYLTCTISRIKPAAAEMYWMIGERRHNGSLTRTLNDDGITWRQSNTLQYTYTVLIVQYFRI